MSVLRLHENLILNPEQEFTCADFAWDYLYENKSSANIQFNGVRRPDLQHNYWALSFTCNFYVTNEETQTKYQVLNFEGATELCHVITPLDIDWQASPRHLKDSLFTEIFPGYEGDINADDAPVAMKVRYAQLTGEMANGSGRNIYTKNPNGTWAITGFNESVPTSRIPAYYKCSKNFSRYFISTDGLRNVKFGARSQMSFGSPHYVGSGSFDDLGSVYTNSNLFGLRTDEGTVYSEGVSFRHHWSVDTYLQNTFQGISVALGATYPVHMVVKAGTYNFGNTTFTFDKDTIFFGTAAYSLKSDGDFGSVIVQVAQDNLFKSYQTRKADMGDDTDPAGGRGPFKVGTDNPLRDITKSRLNGIGTDPTTGSGFYIYRFTDQEWSDFLSWMTSGTNLLENADNIKFIYKSPLVFPTRDMNLEGIKVGMKTIYKPGQTPGSVVSYNVHVVQSTIKEFSSSTTNAWPAQTFSDLEPYSSTTIQIPFCASIAVPPSLIYSSEEDNVSTTVNVKMYYDLLTRAASGTVVVSRHGQGTTHFSSFGECAADCPTVIKRDIVGDVGKQLAPTVAAGVATIATGGTTAPLLVGTAAGAATGFTQSSTNMAQINIPNNSSSGPYWDTVTSGQYTCAVLGLRAPRFTSGEKATYGERGSLVGYTSGYFINRLGNVSDGKNKAYVEVESISLNLGYGTNYPMTKAQADKIEALLKEGVYV